MTRSEAVLQHTGFKPIDPDYKLDNVIAHSARASMGQVLAGTGALVFEGELLELPLIWHPAGTRH